MSDMDPDPEQDQSPEVPTIAGERHFLEQCEYINRSITAIGRQIRSLLRQRGWRSQWCPEDDEEVWSKTFPDGTTQHLGEDDAYRYEEDHARQFFRNTGIAMKPRKRQKPPSPDP
jgi:hypothetical protein